LVSLPGYAPDLNPNEGVWDTLKVKELANVACGDLAERGDPTDRPPG
jgi:transposase